MSEYRRSIKDMKQAFEDTYGSPAAYEKAVRFKKLSEGWGDPKGAEMFSKIAELFEKENKHK